jgi:hypothetical protein
MRPPVSLGAFGSVVRPVRRLVHVANRLSALAKIRTLMDTGTRAVEARAPGMNQQDEGSTPHPETIVHLQRATFNSDDQFVTMALGEMRRDCAAHMPKALADPSLAAVRQIWCAGQRLPFLKGTVRSHETNSTA